MGRDVENKILAILKENNELESNSIKEKLGLTYDTTMKYLKKMTDSDMITRKAKGKPWNYYYRLKTSGANSNELQKEFGGF